jgi:hypothetical protein
MFFGHFHVETINNLFNLAADLQKKNNYLNVLLSLKN